MPVTPTYPGVYIDEIPSQVRTIVGVPTSIAAFVGVAPRGPVNTPVHLTSWGDYVREFGGLADSSLMSYAVFQYYSNGGSEAEIVRVVRTADAGGKKKAVAATLELPTDDAAKKVTLGAATPGGWGSSLRGRVTSIDATHYTLTVRDTGTGAEETFSNIEAKAGSANALSRKVAGSKLVVVADTSFDDLVPKKHDDIDPGKDPFADQPPAAGGGGGGGAGAPAKTYYEQAKDGADGDLPDNGVLLGSDSDTPSKRSGIYALKNLDDRLFNLLCIPPVDRDTDFDKWDEAAKFCVDHRALLLVDAPSGWKDVSDAAGAKLRDLVSGDNAKNAALYFPRLKLQDAGGVERVFVPSGSLAGVIARTDGQRGVWKSPAGIDASVASVRGLTVPLTDLENGRLNPRGINSIRNFPGDGTVVWGARTLQGADADASQWKYVPIRRTALFIEETLFRATRWVVFEPNDEPLWAAIRLNVGAFMNTLWRQGAFQGGTPQAAYLVKCDAENNPQADIDRGIVNVLVGFAPLKPAEFVLIHIQQLAGQTQA
jgi:hypothetical protein